MNVVYRANPPGSPGSWPITKDGIISNLDSMKVYINDGKEAISILIELLNKHNEPIEGQDSIHLTIPDNFSHLGIYNKQAAIKVLSDSYSLKREFKEFVDNMRIRVYGTTFPPSPSRTSGDVSLTPRSQRRVLPFSNSPVDP